MMNWPKSGTRNTPPVRNLGPTGKQNTIVYMDTKFVNY